MGCKDALNSTSNTEETTIKDTNMHPKIVDNTRTSMGAGPAKVDNGGKRGIESSKATDRKEEVRIVAGRKKSTAG
jgi:hypothetical protein